MSCQVCIEDYKGKVKAVTCQYCPSNACRGCQQRYMLQSYEDPHCMECKRGWSSEFMAANFPLSFRNDVLRKHRRKVLLEREKSLLPAIQVYVEYKRNYRHWLAEFERLKTLFGSYSMERYDPEAYALTVSARWQGMRQRYKQLLHKKAEVKHTISQLKLEDPRPVETITQWREKRAVILNDIAALEPEYHAMSQEYITMERQMQAAHNNIWHNDARYRDIAAEGGPPVERREFIMKCPDEGCRGFLSSAYKCGTCAKSTCTQCLVVLGEEEHTCNPDTVETAKTIRSETRPCPKCGTRIFKIDGCFAKDTAIMLWSGSTKLSQDIVIGDVLVGDDGNQRVVEELCSGEDELYEIIQKNGVSYTVNSKHTLVLIIDSSIVEIRVDEYLALSDVGKSQLMGFNSSMTPTGIEVKSVGKGHYYGWSVSGNKRFILSDTTVVRNCDQMWCVMNDCNTAFSWNSGHIVTGTVHNPHYYEWLRRTGGGAAREVGDIPCGGLPNARIMARVVYAFEIDNMLKGRIMETHRNIRELIDMRLQNYPARPQQLMNKDIDVAYLMNELTEVEWQRQLELSEARFKRNKEIGQILQTLATAGADMMNGIVQRGDEIDAEDWVISVALPDLDQLRIFGNDALKQLSKRDHMAVPQLEDQWAWKGARALYRKPKAAPVQ